MMKSVITSRSEDGLKTYFNAWKEHAETNGHFKKKEMLNIES